MSWFLNIQDLKKSLLKQNKSINWVPDHLKEGQFKYTIDTAPDWCISRTRYWATVMPVWECDTCHSREVFGSIDEIEKRSNHKIEGLHRNDVDHVTFPCRSCKGTMKRIPEVLDCWMESGSMPVGQIHYPFENKELFNETFPGDYIIEYIAQVRAWFYYMHVVSNAVFQKNSFKNAVVTGVMAGSDGRKMSKSFGNFPDPKQTLNTYGGDSMRLYLMGSPIMSGEDVSFDEKELRNAISSVINPLMNTAKYLEIYANNAKWSPEHDITSDNIMDRWIQARLASFQEEFERSLTDYHIPQAVHALAPFLDDLSTWYIRRSRGRFVSGDPEALSTLYRVLTNLISLCAPLIPFISEELYQSFVRPFEKDAPLSVHLHLYPPLKKVSSSQKKLLEHMNIVRRVASLGLSLREDAALKLRQPITEVQITTPEELQTCFIETIREELNTKKVSAVTKASLERKKKEKGWLVGEQEGVAAAVMTELTTELREEGHLREIIREIQSARKKHGLQIGEKARFVVVSVNAEVRKLVENKKKDIASAISASELAVKEKKDEENSSGAISVTIDA